MRLCVTVPCFFPDKDLSEVLHTLADIGYDCAEIYEWESLDPAKIRAAAKETGVEITSMCTTEFRLTDPACRADWLAGLKKSCAAAKELGVRHLITQVGNDTHAPRAEQHASIVDGLRAGAPICQEAGVTLMIEPLNTKVDHPGHYLTSAEEAFAIIREVDSPFVKVLYDIYHQQISEGDLLPTILKHLPDIAHLHAAGHPGRHELQNGEINYPYLVKQLDKAGYTGTLGLEYSPLTDPIESLTTVKRLLS